MVDVAVLNMSENDLSFQNLRSKIGRRHRISVRLPSWVVAVLENARESCQ
jgi:hypothetical protein